MLKFSVVAYKGRYFWKCRCTEQLQLIQQSHLHDSTIKYASMKNIWGILCQGIHYLSLHKVSTPLLSGWSPFMQFLSTVVSISLHINIPIKVFRFCNHQSLCPPYTVCTSQLTYPQPLTLCLCMSPRLIPIVMLITCLLCFAGTCHPSKRLPAFHLTQCISTCNSVWVREKMNFVSVTQRREQH